MYIKLIKCHVVPENKVQFSKAQEKWRLISGTQGFIGQIGGWENQNSTNAYIIGFWESKKDLDRFMDEEHDKLLSNNHQDEYYSKIEVNFFQELIDMAGESTDIRDAIGKSKVIRIADCILRPNRKEHFIKIQNEVWYPGMKRVEGMLGGSFGVCNSKNRYLVITLWSSIEHHKRYMNEEFHHLLSKVNLADDIEKISGSMMILEDEWNVL